MVDSEQAITFLLLRHCRVCAWLIVGERSELTELIHLAADQRQLSSFWQLSHSSFQNSEKYLSPEFSCQKSILTSKLSSYVSLEWCFTTLSQNLISCSTLSQEHCMLISWYWKIMRRQLITLTCPYLMLAYNERNPNNSLKRCFSASGLSPLVPALLRI